MSMKMLAVAPACAAILLGLVATADAKARRAAPQNAASVTLTNARGTPLQDLEITTAGEPPVVVAKLAKPLDPGKSVTLPIRGKRGCMFDVRGAYTDDATVEHDGVDLCKDAKLRLSE